MTNEIIKLFDEIIERSILNKAVFSKPSDKTIQKLVLSPFKAANGDILLATETFRSDNKSIRKNHPYSSKILCESCENFKQVNVFTTAGNIEIRISKSNSVHIAGKLSNDASPAEISEHDGKKNYILDSSRDSGFLSELGLADKNGRIHDKKQAKFRQINKFLEIIQTVESELPTNRPFVIYDLCCGKSYLTFAVYYYFNVLKKRDVRMYGVDLKKDVIDFCNNAAKRQGFENLKFVSGNINEYTPPEKPDMVISLHACDIATDIVLYNAVRWGASIILSTPCCHHEMSRQLSEKSDAPLKKELDFILSSPMLKQKLCDTLTDALRVKRLSSCGYNVTTLELIDPDETPKNLMIRAIFDKNKSESEKAHELSEYLLLCENLGVHPFLEKLLKNES